MFEFNFVIDDDGRINYTLVRPDGTFKSGSKKSLIEALKVLNAEVAWYVRKNNEDKQGTSRNKYYAF